MEIPKLTLTPVKGTRKWIVDQDFVVKTEAFGWVHVPVGFVCDLNSIPRFLWWSSTPADYPEAGVVHDFLYDRQAPKELADLVYKEILLALGMGEKRAQARWLGLHLFGGPAYRSHRKG